MNSGCDPDAKGAEHLATYAERSLDKKSYARSVTRPFEN